MAKVDEAGVAREQGVETPASSAWGEAAFTWGAWLLLLVAALLFTLHFAPAAPVCDDWTLTIPTMTGATTFDLPFLWSQTNEHRLPLPKLVVIPLFYLTGGTFWAENVLNVLTLAALAAALIATATRLRGRTRFTDAIFPLALLHLGHADLFVYRLTFNHVLATVFCCALMMTVARQERGLTWQTLLKTGALLVGLVGCGANGLPVALGGSLWLVSGAWRSSGGQDSRFRRGAAVVVAGAAAGLVGLYFVGYWRPVWFPRPESVKMLLEGSVKVLGRSAIPYQGGAVFWVGLLLTALLAVTAAILARAALREPERRWRAIGLLLLLGAAATTALGIAWGRAASGETASAASRYAVVTVPAALGCYLAWVVMGPRRGRGLVQVGLFALFAFTFGFQTLDGLAIGSANSLASLRFLRELRAGAPSDCLAHRYGGPLYPVGLVPLVERHLAEARARGLGPFRGTSEMPYQRENLELIANIHDSTWEGGAASPQGPRPYLDFSLGRPRAVKALRVRCTLEKPGGEAGPFQVSWKGPGQTFDPVVRQERTFLPSGPEVQTVFVWVDGVIDQVRIAYDASPCQLTIHEIAILYLDPATDDGTTKGKLGQLRGRPGEPGLLRHDSFDKARIAEPADPETGPRPRVSIFWPPRMTGLRREIVTATGLSLVTIVEDDA